MLKTLLSCCISKNIFFSISSHYTVGEQSLCWTASSETWTGKHCRAFNMSELVIGWSSFWKMLVMTAANHIHPLCAQWDGQQRGSLSVSQVILHLSRLLSCWTIKRAFKWNTTHLKPAGDTTHRTKTTEQFLKNSIIGISEKVSYCDYWLLLVPCWFSF